MNAVIKNWVIGAAITAGLLFISCGDENGEGPGGPGGGVGPAYFVVGDFNDVIIYDEQFREKKSVELDVFKVTVLEFDRENRLVWVLGWCKNDNYKVYTFDLNLSKIAEVSFTNDMISDLSCTPYGGGRAWVTSSWRAGSKVRLLNSKCKILTTVALPELGYLFCDALGKPTSANADGSLWVQVEEKSGWYHNKAIRLSESGKILAETPVFGSQGSTLPAQDLAPGGGKNLWVNWQSGTVWKFDGAGKRVLEVAEKFDPDVHLTADASGGVAGTPNGSEYFYYCSASGSISKSEKLSNNIDDVVAYDPNDDAFYGFCMVKNEETKYYFYKFDPECKVIGEGYINTDFRYPDHSYRIFILDY